MTSSDGAVLPLYADDSQHKNKGWNPGSLPFQLRAFCSWKRVVVTAAVVCVSLVLIVSLGPFGRPTPPGGAGRKASSNVPEVGTEPEFRIHEVPAPGLDSPRKGWLPSLSRWWSNTASGPDNGKEEAEVIYEDDEDEYHWISERLSSEHTGSPDSASSTSSENGQPATSNSTGGDQSAAAGERSTRRRRRRRNTGKESSMDGNAGKTTQKEDKEKDSGTAAGAHTLRTPTEAGLKVPAEGDYEEIQDSKNVDVFSSVESPFPDDLRAADLGLSEQPVDLKEMEAQSAAADPVKSSIPDVTKLEGPTDVPGDTEDARQKRNAVRRAFVYAYEAYKKHAFGHDELKPQSRSHHDWIPGGAALTMLDSLDTMKIMGLEEYFAEGAHWVENFLNLDRDAGISVFECNIRLLGGLISAYDLSGNNVFLNKARVVADKLLAAFNTPSGIPHTTVNLLSGHSSNPSWSGGASILSEVGTLQVEFKALSDRTGDPRYAEKVTKIMDVIARHLPEHGLAGLYISAQDGHFTTSSTSFGALGDSYYEYLIKQYLLTSKKEKKYRRLYDQAMNGMHQHLILKSKPSGLTYIAEWNGNTPSPKMDELACFTGGMLALGAEGDRASKDLQVAAELTETCYQFFKRMPSGIAPELVHFRDGSDFVPGASYYILRPETVESFFYMWRSTHDQKYRDWGWEVFQSIEKHCKVPNDGGYAGLKNVMTEHPVQDDLMQSFFLAETLKYLFLLFSPDNVIPLDQYVFNTEAHPIRIFDPSPSTHQSWLRPE